MRGYHKRQRASSIRLACVVPLLLLTVGVFGKVSAQQGVASPYVNDGMRAFITDGFYASDGAGDDAFRVRMMLRQDVSDRLSLRTRIRYQDDASEPFSFRDIELIGVYELTEKGQWWVDSGIFASVFMGDDGQKRYSTRFLAAKTFPDWQYRANVMLSNAFGASWEQLEPEMRLRATTNINSHLAVGAEYFGKWPAIEGIQGTRHSRQLAGPLVSYRLHDMALTMESAILLGANDSSSDALFKWRVGVGF